MTRAISHQISFEELKQDHEFIMFWDEVLKGIRRFGMNEAMLGYVHRAKQRMGDINQINAQSALDMHRLEGSLEIWEKLLYLTSEPLPMSDLKTEDEDEETTIL